MNWIHAAIIAPIDKLSVVFVILFGGMLIVSGVIVLS